MYGFVLGPLRFQSTSQNTHLTSKAVILAVLALFDTPPLKPTKTETSFRKLNSLPTKLRMLFPTHLQARELGLQTYSLSLTLEWSQVTHTPASIKSRARPTSPKSQFSTVPLPDNCVMTPVFQDGSLLFQYTHKHSSPLRQAVHTQIANHHIQRATKSFS